MEYTESKIIETVPSGKLAYFIRVKHKGEALPGQYFKAWVPGFGETSLSISSSNKEYKEFLATKKDDALRKIFSLRQKDTVLLRGPYGHGFPMNNLKDMNLVMIGQTPFFSPLWSAFEYIKENQGYYKRVSLIVQQTKPRKAFLERLEKLKGEKKEDISITQDTSEFEKIIRLQKPAKNTVYLLSLEENMLKEAEIGRASCRERV